MRFLGDEMENKTILAFGAHPDDVEFGCGGTLLLLKEIGFEIIIVDLTKGEKSVHGTSRDERIKEAEESAEILGIKRDIYDLGDKNISLSEEHKKIVKKIIERYKPSLTFAPYFIDKHPDHINTSKLISDFVKPIYYYISDVKNPNLAVDISNVYDTKVSALNAHKSQIKPGDPEWLEERNRDSGKMINSNYGELFYAEENLNLPSIFVKLK